jgi:hypothetical protein
LEKEDICEWPTDLAISVVPHEDSWKVSIMRDGPQQDADRCEMIEAIADRLRNQFDLKGEVGLVYRPSSDALGRDRP